MTSPGPTIKSFHKRLYTVLPRGVAIPCVHSNSTEASSCALHTFPPRQHHPSSIKPGYDGASDMDPWTQGPKLTDGLDLTVQVSEDAYFVCDNAMGVAEGVGGWSHTRMLSGTIFYCPTFIFTITFSFTKGRTISVGACRSMFGALLLHTFTSLPSSSFSVVHLSLSARRDLALFWRSSMRCRATVACWWCALIGPCAFAPNPHPWIPLQTTSATGHCQWVQECGCLSISTTSSSILFRSTALSTPSPRSSRALTTPILFSSIALDVNFY